MCLLLRLRVLIVPAQRFVYTCQLPFGTVNQPHWQAMTSH